MSVKVNKISIKDLERFIVEWNYKFRFDRIYRNKYNIGLFSAEHLSLNQIDIYMDLFEDRLVEKAQKAYDQRKKDLEDFKKDGKFLKEHELTSEEEEQLFKKFRLK